VQHVLVGVLAGAFAAQVIANSFSWPTAVRLGFAVVAGVLAGIAHARFVAARLFLVYAAAAPVVFVFLFAFASRAGDLLRAGDVAAATTNPGTGAPVVVVVLDELPTASLLDGRGHIDRGLYPNLAALADHATWYRNNTAMASITEDAVPSIMTGRYPRPKLVVPTSSNYPKSIFTLLGRNYQLHVREKLTRVCPPSLCTPVGGGGARAVLKQARSLWWDRFDPTSKAKRNVFQFSVGGDVLGGQRAAEFRDWIGGVDATPRRLDFVHTVLPHQGWDLTPDVQLYQGGVYGLFYYSWIDDEAPRVRRQRHFMQTQAVDKMLGELFARLRAQGMYDKALIAVTADHGVAFDTHEPIRALSKGNFVDIAWAPMFVKAPDQTKGRIDDRNAESIDLLPTIADILNVRIPWRVDGRSLLGPPRPNNEKKIVHYTEDVLKPNQGSYYVYDGTAGFRTLLSRGAAVPGAGSDPLRIFRAGKWGRLVGRPVSDLDVGSGVTISGLASLRSQTVAPNFDPPPHFGIETQVDAKGGTTIGVAIDGRFATWSSVHPDVNNPNIWWVLPPSLMPVGHHELAFYEIDGPPDAPTLHPVRDG
jgi:hypothetical protein